MTNDDGILLTIGDKFATTFVGRRNDLALFVSLGSALAEIQSFEGLLIFLLRALHTTPGGNEVSMSETFYQETLGSLIRKFRKFLPDSGIDALLENAREKRNYIVHEVLHKYQWPMMSDEHYVLAIQEIEAVRSSLESANSEISKYLSDKSLLDLIVLQFDKETGEITRVVVPEINKR